MSPHRYYAILLESSQDRILNSRNQEVFGQPKLPSCESLVDSNHETINYLMKHVIILDDEGSIEYKLSTSVRGIVLQRLLISGIKFMLFTIL